jgi:L-lysine exporter family protein LysE/ArgO
MTIVLAGLLTGLSLIVAIGAQNAYVLRLGLTRHYVGLAVFICAVSDVLLIVLGIGGIGRIVRAVPSALQVIKWVGVVYLVGFALLSFWRARRPEVLLPAESVPPSRRVVIATTLAFTFLNPHVYLDTVLLVGSIGNQYGSQRWLFAAGAAAASILWFTALGYGARGASRLMSRPITWRILDLLIGVVMLAIAINLLVTPLATPA